jgi:predicted metal-binding membrane protein
MGYLCKVTDIPHDHALPNLSAADARIAALVNRPRRIAIGCVIALTALGWTVLGVMAADKDIWAALCQPLGAEGGIELLLVLAMWAAMALAMMLPTAAPMILTYAETADTAARQREPAASPLYLTAGYIAVWLGFAVAATALQFALTQAALLDAGRASVWLAGAIFLFAGVYQFSKLKHACLAQCQRPFPFFFANWTAEPRGVFRLGLRQGLWCVGCCWATMLIMLAAGAMNVVWMAALGAAMTVEKMTTRPRFSQAMGILFVAMGLGLAVMALGK